MFQLWWSQHSARVQRCMSTALLRARDTCVSISIIHSRSQIPIATQTWVEMVRACVRMRIQWIRWLDWVPQPTMLTCKCMCLLFTFVVFAGSIAVFILWLQKNTTKVHRKCTNIMIRPVNNPIWSHVNDRMYIHCWIVWDKSSFLFWYPSSQRIDPQQQVSCKCITSVTQQPLFQTQWSFSLGTFQTDVHIPHQEHDLSVKMRDYIE